MWNFKNLRIKNKIMIMNMGILIPLILFTYIVLINNLYKNVVRNAVEFLTKESYNSQLYIANYIEKNKSNDIELDFVHKNSLINTYLNNKLNFRIQIYDKTGSLLSDSKMDNLALYNVDITKAIKGEKAYVIKNIDGENYILFSSPIYSDEGTLGVVRYIYNLKSEQNLIHSMFIIMILLALISIFISWILSKIFAEKITEPIGVLKSASEKIISGNYDNLIDIRSGDEIQELANSFNMTTRSIKNYIETLTEEKQKQKDFLDNVTHEFKTPLTAIIGYSELIPKLKDDDDISESLDYIKKEGERLLKLVEELLELSKLGKAEFNVELKCNSLNDIVIESLNIIGSRVDKYGIKIYNHCFDLDIISDHDKTKQVILNILDNAIKYSECRSITMNMDDEGKYVVLNIIDDGIGIKTEHLDKIFNPIYRVNKSTSRSKNGNGLGLSICKEIMNKQLGDIKIYSDYKSGTIVKLRFSKFSK